MKTLSVLVLCLYGCALAPLDRARVSTTTAVHVYEAASAALEEMDKAMAAAAIAKYQAGDEEGARADWAAWEKKFEKCQRALAFLQDAIVAAADAVAAVDKGKAALAADTLIKALADLAKLFADAGIKLPGVLP